jgi:membrane protein implicated in regulation of membrane protease activity
MEKKTKRNLTLVLGILFIVLAVIVFALAEGLRKWYSGIFFMILGVVMLLSFRRYLHEVDK